MKFIRIIRTCLPSNIHMYFVPTSKIEKFQDSKYTYIDFKHSDDIIIYTDTINTDAFVFFFCEQFLTVTFALQAM